MKAKMKKIILSVNQLREAVNFEPEIPINNTADALKAVNDASKSDGDIPTDITLPNRAPNANKVANVQAPYNQKDLEDVINDPEASTIKVLPNNNNGNSLQTNALAEKKYSKKDIEHMRLNEMRRKGKVMTKKELEETFKQK